MSDKPVLSKGYQMMLERIERDPLFRERCYWGETLTEKQKIFCEEYARTGRVMHAARVAGYSNKKGNPMLMRTLRRLLSRPDVKLYLENLKSQERERREVTRDYIVMKLKDLIEKDKVKPSDKINAITTLAKISGLMKDTSDGQKVVVFQVAGLEEEKTPAVVVDSGE